LVRERAIRCARKRSIDQSFLKHKHDLKPAGLCFAQPSLRAVLPLRSLPSVVSAAQ
jgi:hypothetical protein